MPATFALSEGRIGRKPTLEATALSSSAEKGGGKMVISIPGLVGSCAHLDLTTLTSGVGTSVRSPQMICRLETGMACLSDVESDSVDKWL